MQIEKIAPSGTAMIVVDMQNNFGAFDAAMKTPAARAMVPKLAEALQICRHAGIRVVDTAPVHRRDGSDMGLFDDMHPPIASRAALVDETPGVEIYPDLAPHLDEHVIKTHRYSGFFGTDLDILLREWGIDTVIISGTTTENCCHARARDAMFRNHQVVFLSDAPGTYDYPDRGFGAMPIAAIHHATLVILAPSTAHTMAVADMTARISCRIMRPSRSTDHVKTLFYRQYLRPRLTPVAHGLSLRFKAVRHGRQTTHVEDRHAI